MPWTEKTAMSLRLAFVRAASAEGAIVRALCRMYQISARTGYKWLARYQAEGEEGLLDRSRRPACQPGRTCSEVEEAALDVRRAHPAWGGRKIAALLGTHARFASETPGALRPPSPSTIGAILKRHDCLDPEEARKRKPFVRFEYPAPNALWQMDFKGDFALSGGRRCYPLDVLDDYSRYCLLLQACADQQGETVKERLTRCFREYGLPERMLMDNGPPWGNPQRGALLQRTHTRLEVWLMRLRIVVIHGRPWHPQTQGKEERFHRTLRAEVLEEQFVYSNFKVKNGTRGQGLCAAALGDHAACQALFDPWRDLYNHVRPHEALQMKPPACRYQKSPRAFPEELAPVQYDMGPSDQQVRVNATGDIRWQGRIFHIGDAFRGLPLLLRPQEADDRVWSVHFCQQRLGALDLTEQTSR